MGSTAVGAGERTAKPAVGLTEVGAGERTAKPAVGSAAADAREATGASLAGSDLGARASDPDIGRGDARHIPNARRGAARPVIAVARDEAFCFYYPENLELLAEAGAEIEFFSPLRGQQPAADAAGVYLGGGYPELHAAQLAENVGLWRALARLKLRDAPIYAECGGFMVLTEALIDGEGRRWPMAGLIPGVARMTGKLAALGYRHATAARANLLTESGDVLRGHEFRYSTWERDEQIGGNEAAWQLRGTRAQAPGDSGGFVSGNLLASYLHIHFGQRAALAHRFVARLAAHRRLFQP